MKPHEPLVLFFSRGRGYGHAIPDMAILKEWEKIEDRLAVKFVSYATGAQVLKNAGHDIIDLPLPENNPFIDTLKLAYQVIAKLRPRIVVCHEEFAAVTAAKLQGIPSIYVSAWLPAARTIWAESLTTADSIVMIERPGIFPLPPRVTAPVHYAGPILRRMKYTWKDRLALRREMGIEDDALVILVVPGGWAVEDRSPISDVVLAAFVALPARPKRLFWLAGRDAESLRRRTAMIEGVTVLDFVAPIERMMAPCDVVITKGTRGVTLDAASVGVPSISLSSGENPVDELLVPRVRNNTALNPRAVTGAILADYIEKAAAGRVTRPRNADEFSFDGAETAARLLASETRRLAGSAREPVAATELLVV